MSGVQHEANTRRVYDAAAPAYVRMFGEDFSDLRWLDALGRSTRHGVLLDAGSGPGHFAKYLSRYVRTVALDLSSDMLRVGRRAGIAVPAVQGSMAKLPFRAEVFDAILVAYSFLHIAYADASAVLGELRRTAKLRAQCLVTVKEGVGEETIAATLAPGEFLHATYWTRSSLEPLLTKAGWAVTGIDYGVPARPAEIQRRKIAFFLEATDV